MDIYIKKPEVVRAVRLDSTADSMDECREFIKGTKVLRVNFYSDVGILIELLDMNLRLNFGEYIVKDFRGEFEVLSEQSFNTLYTKVVTGEFKKENSDDD